MVATCILGSMRDAARLPPFLAPATVLAPLVCTVASHMCRMRQPTCDRVVLAGLGERPSIGGEIRLTCQRTTYARGESSFGRHVHRTRPRGRDKRLSLACGDQFLGRPLVGERRDLLPIPLAERSSAPGLLRQPPAFGRGRYHLPLPSDTRCREALGQHHSARVHSGRTGLVTTQRGTYVA